VVAAAYSTQRNTASKNMTGRGFLTTLLVLCALSAVLLQCAAPASAYTQSTVRKVQVSDGHRADFSLSTFNGDIKWAYTGAKKALGGRQSMTEITVEEIVTVPNADDLSDVQTGFTGMCAVCRWPACCALCSPVERASLTVVSAV
jgi:hypothetical protein